MSILMKQETPGPTLNVADFKNMNTADIFQVVREKGIRVVIGPHIDCVNIKRDQPPSELDLYGFVPTSPVVRTTALQQGLQDAGVESYFEAMAALSLYVREVGEGPDTTFFTLLPIKGRDPVSREEMIHYIYCSVCRRDMNVKLVLMPSLPVDWQQGHKIKQNDKILVAFKKALPKPVYV